MMNGKAMMQERAAMVDNVYQFRHNKRVLLGSNIFSWAILDEGYRLNEALYDYDKLMTVMRHQQERYGFDVYTDVMNRNPQRATCILGGGWTRVDDAKEAINVLNHQVMRDGDMEKFIDNPEAYFYTCALQNYCKKGITLGELKVAVREYNLFWKCVEDRKRMLWDEYGCLQFFNSFVKAPFEDYWQDHRGMRGAALDVRRRPEQLQEMLDVYFETQTLPALEARMQVEGHEGYVSDMNIALLACNYLSIPQFERFYLPHLRKIIDTAVAHHKRIFLFVEGSMLRFAEYLQDVPKGSILMSVETDDIFEVRKRLPNIALAGGMTSVMLGQGTAQECVNRAKKLIDELGDGFILYQDKMMSFRNDAKQENLIAVNDFARSYTV